MSGYSTDAVDALTLGKSLNIILFGPEDIDSVMLERSSFKNILKSKLRIAAEEGIVYHSTEVEQASKDGKTIIEAFSYDDISSRIVRQDSNYRISSDLVVICEGSSDRELIALLATKILSEYNLSKKINIIVANGKMSIPRVANAAANIVTNSPVLVVADSDNDIGLTKDILNHGINLDTWRYSIPDPEIESWLELDGKEFRRRFKREERPSKLAELVENLDLNSLAEKNSSFKEFFNWVKSS